MGFGQQMVMLAIWLVRLLIGLAVAFGFIDFVLHRWGVKSFLVEQLEDKNYAVAFLVGVVIYSVLRNVG